MANPKEMLQNFSDKRAEKKQLKIDTEYDEMHPEIVSKIDEQYTALRDPNFSTAYEADLQSKISAIEDASASDDEKALKVRLTKELADFQGAPDDEAKIELYTAANVRNAQIENAKQIAARMDTTFNIKEGTNSKTTESHKNWLIAVGVMARNKVEKMGLPTELEEREEKLKLMLGDPANTNPDDLSANAVGEQGLLDLEVAEQRKQRSKFYDAEVDSTTGDVKAKRNEKGELREVLGRKWRRLSSKGWKGKAAKILIGAGLGAAFGVTAGFLGAGLIGVAGAAAVARTLKHAGTASIEKAGAISAADEDARAQIERMRNERTEMFTKLAATPDDYDENKDVWRQDARTRANELNKTHKRTTVVMGATALLGGATAIEGVKHFFDSSFNRGFGYVGDGVKKTADWAGNVKEDIFGSDTTEAKSGETNSGTTGDVNPAGSTNTGEKPTGDVNPAHPHPDHDPAVTGDVNPAHHPHPDHDPAVTGDVNPAHPHPDNAPVVTGEVNPVNPDTDNDPTTNSTPEAYSAEARTIEKGTGFYHQFDKFGIPAAEQPALLEKVGPELERMGVAYKIDSGPYAGQYGMLETPRGGQKGVFPKEAIDYIVKARATK